jgi:hypothetical protein
MTLFPYIIAPPVGLPMSSRSSWSAPPVSKPQAAGLPTTHGVFPMEVTP